MTSFRAPEYLDPVAAATYRRLAPKFAGMGTLADVDREALALSCAAFSIARAAYGELRVASGLSLSQTVPQGVIQRPEVTIFLKAFAASMNGFGRMGMMASERGKLKAEISNADRDPLEAARDTLRKARAAARVHPA